MNNLSQFEDDPFADLNTSDVMHHVDYKPSALETTLHIYSVVTSLMKLGISVLTVGAAIMLVYVVRKFEKLKTKQNEYLMHYAIAILIYFFFLPMFEIFNEISTILKVGIETYCILFQLECLSLFLMFIFGTAMGVEWYILVYQQDWAQKYVNLRKYSILALYSVGVIKLLINCGLCFHRSIFFSNHILNFSFIIMTLVIVFINFQNLKYPKDNPKNRYLLIVSTFIICSWMPLFAYHYLFSFFYDEESDAMMVFLSMTDCIPEFIAFIHPVIVVYLLGRANKHFKMAYDSIFKRWSYKNEDLDEVSDDENDTATNGTNSLQITTENGTEENGVLVF